MKKYTVSIEREAQQICVGEIMGDSSETASFCYSETYLNSKNATAISISLSKGEKYLFMEKARNYGLSLSAFLRLAALEYIEKHREGNKHE